MNNWLHRTLIVPDEVVEYARALTLAVAGESAAGMWTTPITNNEQSTSTHWITVGLIGEEFAAIIPLMQIAEDENLQSTTATISTGRPEICLHLATQAGFKTTIEEIMDLYSKSLIFEDEGIVILNKMDFKIIDL